MMGGINVKRHKMVMIVACLLIVGLLPFLYFFSYTQTNQVSEREQALVMTEKWQDLRDQTEKNDSAEEAEVQQSEDEEIVPTTAEVEIQQSTDEENNSQTI